MERSLPCRSLATNGRAIVGLLLALTALSCHKPRVAPTPAYLAEIERWRAERLASLTAEDGWLTLVGLYWLQPGENWFGSDPANDIPLSGEGVPPLAGSFEVQPSGVVLLRARPEAGVRAGGAAVGELALHSDRSREQDVLAIGGLRLYLIDRAGQLAIRVKDPGSPTRTHFKGIDHFPADPSCRVEGTFEPYPSPREVLVPAAHGPQQKMLAPGLVRFSLGGGERALEPFTSSPTDPIFFFVFRDSTSGSETYGGGRFLDADAPAPGSRKVVLDFNRAYNPPCVFTPFATCPLPPPANTLPLRIEAGEKVAASH